MQPTLSTSSSFLIAPEVASTPDTQPLRANETLVYQDVVFTFLPTCFGSLCAPLMSIPCCWGETCCMLHVSTLCRQHVQTAHTRAQHAHTHASESLTSGGHLHLQQTDLSSSFGSDPPHSSCSQPPSLWDHQLK